jgi:SAM-dependent methyltransferase
MRRKPFRKSKEGKMATTLIDREIAAAEKERSINSQPYGIYACPTCKHALEPRSGILCCHACALDYPILDGIPDFIAQDLGHITSHDPRYIAKSDGSRWLNFLTSSYETYLYPPVCNLFGGWHSTSLQELARDISDIVGPTTGAILDVACGPGTYGRRLASSSRVIYGIDISLSMLRVGVRYVERDGLPNVHFARALVEKLPFPTGLFDAAICAGSLNHFPDTVLALREINRTMKAGAPLAVMCFVISNRGVLKYKFMHDRAESKGAHIFAVADLEGYVAEAGFEGFHPRLYGAIGVFRARKRATDR